MKLKKFFFNQVMWHCGIQSIQSKQSHVYKLVALNPNFNTEHLARIFIDQNQFIFEVSYTVSQYRMA